MTNSTETITEYGMIQCIFKYLPAVKFITQVDRGIETQLQVCENYGDVR